MRWTVAQLRQHFSSVLKMDGNEFRIFKDGELKDSSKPTSYYGIKSGSEVSLSLGRPLLPTEYIFKIFFWIPNSTPPAEPFEFIESLVFDENWTMDRVKQEIFNYKATIPISRMRLRDRLGTRLTKVYSDDLTLRENCGKFLSDFREIIVQQTVSDEYLTRDHILVNVAVWNPELSQLSHSQEIALTIHDTIAQTKLYLSKLFSIDFDHAKCSHPLGYQLKDPSSTIPLLDWDSNPSAIITDKPWSLKHGDFILIKDDRVPERISATTRCQSPPHARLSVSASMRQDEPSLRIFTNKDAQ
jgi:hypothetical protein